MKRSFCIPVAFALFTVTAPVQAADARVKVINESRYRVISINVSPPYRNKYGSQDLLGRNTLSPGYNIVINFDVGDAENTCLLDIRANGPDGIKWEKRMDVCTETEWTLKN